VRDRTDGKHMWVDRLDFCDGLSILAHILDVKTLLFSNLTLHLHGRSGITVYLLWAEQTLEALKANVFRLHFPTIFCSSIAKHCSYFSIVWRSSQIQNNFKEKLMCIFYWRRVQWLDKSWCVEHFMHFKEHIWDRSGRVSATT